MAPKKEDATMSAPEPQSLNIHQRILLCMAEVPYVQKVQRKTGLQYTFVTRDAVVSKLREAMIKHGVVYLPTMQSWSVDGNKTTMEVMNRYACADNPQDYVEFPTLGYGIDPQDKGPGKAMTYCEKLAHLKQFMIEAGDEDECEHYDEAHKPGDKAPAKTGKRETPANEARATPVTGSLDDLKAKYVEMAKKYGIDLKAFGEAFGSIVPEDSRKDPVAVNRGLLEMEKRYCAWMDVLDAVKKWSVSGNLFDASVAKIVGPDDTLGKDNYFLYSSDTLTKITNQLHADNDLPFDSEGQEILK